MPARPSRSSLFGSFELDRTAACIAASMNAGPSSDQPAPSARASRRRRMARPTFPNRDRNIANESGVFDQSARPCDESVRAETRWRPAMEAEVRRSLDVRENGNDADWHQIVFMPGAVRDAAIDRHAEIPAAASSAALRKSIDVTQGSAIVAPRGAGIESPMTLRDLDVAHRDAIQAAE